MKNKYLYILFGILLLAILGTILKGSFIKPSNLMVILRQTSILLMLSLGLTVVVITGNIDLSVGSVAALTGCICARLMIGSCPIPLAILLSLFVGILFGFFNGLLVGLLGLPSFVATYGMNMLVSGVSLMIMQGGIIYDLPKSFHWIGVGYIYGIPVPIILSLIMTVIFALLLEQTKFGRNIYMIGHNRTSFFYAGNNDLKLLLKTFILSGLTASIGGIMLTARLNAADAGMSETYGIQIVAAVVVGGTSLFGGSGGVEGTFLGALILTMIINIMNMNGVHSNWQNFVLGIIILLIVWINVLASRKNKNFMKLKS